MITRKITPLLKQMAREYGVVSLTGPRQSGKTTLVKQVFASHRYYNFENLSDLEAIRRDPVEFIRSLKGGVILDEVQHFPEILSYIQVAIDQKFQSGKFILTGSQNLLMSEKVSQSLAGRVGVLTLYPLTLGELKQAHKLPKHYTDLLLKGLMPALYARHLTPHLFYDSYLKTYVERDVRLIKNITDLSAFTKLMRLLAGRVGQMVNLNELGGIVGVSYKTISNWLSVLEASYLIFRLSPYHKNLKKRLVKSPKIYFTEVGLATHLLGLGNVEAIQTHFSLGGLVENLVILDFYKRKLNTASLSQLYFYRDSGGHEVDLIIEQADRLIPVEIKASATFSGEFLKNIHYFNRLVGQASGGYLVYNGKSHRVQGVEVVPFKQLDQAIDINLPN